MEVDKLKQTARLALSGIVRRAVELDLIKIIVTNFDNEVKDCGGTTCITFEVKSSPTNTTLGIHAVEMMNVIYIDASDLQLQEEKSYYELVPNKAVGLKYHGRNLICGKY